MLSFPPYLIVMHGDIKLIVELQRLGPDDAPVPEHEVAVHLLHFYGDIKNILLLVQRPDVLICKGEMAQAWFQKQTAWLNPARKGP